MDKENKFGTLNIQKELLVLLKEFHSFADSYQIKYSLAYGSLLGAVRHKGFIPWDDDLDIIVDRSNYLKIIDAVGKQKVLEIERATKRILFLDRLRLYKENSDNSYNATLDVFILDSVPDNIFFAKLKMYFIFMLMGMMKSNFNVRKGGAILKCCSLLTFLIGKFFPYKLKYRWFHSVSAWGNNKKTKFLRCYNASFEDVHCLFQSSIMDNVFLAPFEGCFFYIMEGYDQFLKSRYGDYMTPPSFEEQVPKHYH